MQTRDNNEEKNELQQALSTFNTELELFKSTCNQITNHRNHSLSQRYLAVMIRLKANVDHQFENDLNLKFHFITMLNNSLRQANLPFDQNGSAKAINQFFIKNISELYLVYELSLTKQLHLIYNHLARLLENAVLPEMRETYTRYAEKQNMNGIFKLMEATSLIQIIMANLNNTPISAVDRLQEMAREEMSGKSNNTAKVFSLLCGFVALAICICAIPVSGGLSVIGLAFTAPWLGALIGSAAIALGLSAASGINSQAKGVSKAVGIFSVFARFYEPTVSERNNTPNPITS